MVKHRHEHEPEPEEDIPPEINPEDIVPQAPEQQPVPAPTPPPAVVEGYVGSPWQEGWRSALDDPEHPLHHLRNT